MKYYENALKGDHKLTVTDIKNRAVQFAKDNGNPTFNPSKGWILRFLQLGCTRENLIFRKIGSIEIVRAM